MMTTQRRAWMRRLLAPAALVLLAATTGCPPAEPPDGSSDYELGFYDGFMEDEQYWTGFWDSVNTVDLTPILYQGSDIPYYEDESYEAGYWDGVWQAYNDGYFVAYHFAFIIGFSEGYDAAFWEDYLDFLATDMHQEFMNGGWTDGYNDGFSEGRVFGANDYEQGLTFDWLDALLDYEAGTDLHFAEVDVGTGVYGPVILYEYGVDPALKTTIPRRRAAVGMLNKIRADGAEAKTDDDMYRGFPEDLRSEFEVAPDNAPRSDRSLRLDSTWYQRFNNYLDSAGIASAKSIRTRVAR
jgi:hypothetical protein